MRKQSDRSRPLRLREKLSSKPSLSAEVTTADKQAPTGRKKSLFQTISNDFARAARQQTRNLARYLKPPVIVMLFTVLFLSWVVYRWAIQPPWLYQLTPGWVEFFDLYEFGSTVTLLILWGFVWQRNRTPQQEPTTTIDSLYALTPYEFEHFVAQVFQKKGYNVTLRGRSGDMGVDLEIRKGPRGKRAIVQCKRYRNQVGPDTVRELYGTLRHEKVSHAFLVTTAKISASARSWARNKPLTLIDGTALVDIASELKIKR